MSSMRALRNPQKKAELSLLNRESNGDGSQGRGDRGRGRNKYKDGCGGGRGGKGTCSTDPSKRNCYYCGQTSHTKNDCQTFKKERDKLFCGHCDINGHDKSTCFKLKPELEHLQDGARKLNKFGKGEHAGAAVGSKKSDKDGDVELN